MQNDNNAAHTVSDDSPTGPDTPPTVHPSTEPSEDEGFNSALYLEIVARLWKQWLLLAVVVFFISLGVGTLLMPQTYAASISISMQQASPSPSGLLALAGGGSRKYTGVIKSRLFAEDVDSIVHFRQLLGLKTSERNQREVIDKLMKDLKVEDNTADGLLYVTVSLPGPPKLWPDPGGRRRAQLSSAVAKAANLYGKELQDYLLKYDTDKDLVLLRSADPEVKDAQVKYNAALERLSRFVKSSRVRVVPTSSSSNSGAADATSGALQLATLYGRLGELQTKLNSSDALLSGTKGILSNPKQNIETLPAEDPLLVNARRQVATAETDLNNLQISLGPAMPSVRRAQERLRLARENLHREVETILKGNTSEQVKRQALQIEYQTVAAQIATAEKSFQLNRNTAVDMEKYRNDVILRLESLKAIMTKYAELKLQTASAQSRMAVIDQARPPLQSNPGLGVIIGSCGAIALAAMAVMSLIAYMRISNGNASLA